MIEFDKYLAIMFITEKIVQIFFKFFIKIYLILCENLLIFSQIFLQIFFRKLFLQNFFGKKTFFKDFYFVKFFEKNIFLKNFKKNYCPKKINFTKY